MLAGGYWHFLLRHRYNSIAGSEGSFQSLTDEVPGGEAGVFFCNGISSALQNITCLRWVTGFDGWIKHHLSSSQQSAGEVVVSELLSVPSSSETSLVVLQGVLMGFVCFCLNCSSVPHWWHRSAWQMSHVGCQTLLRSSQETGDAQSSQSQLALSERSSFAQLPPCFRAERWFVGQLFPEQHSIRWFSWCQLLLEWGFTSWSMEA